MAQVVKSPPSNAGDLVSVPGSGGCPEENGYPLQYSAMENSMERRAIGSQRIRHDFHFPVN